MSPQPVLASRRRPLWQRLWRRQSLRSGVSAIGFGFIGALIAADLMLRTHTVTVTIVESIMVAVCAAGTIAALALGNRFPRWGGAVVGLLTIAGVAVFVAFSITGPAIVGALLIIPPVALYLGWGIRPWSARAVLLGLIFAVVGALQTNLTFQTSVLLDGATPVYAAVVSWFCLEVAIILGGRLRRAARTDSLTQALNRRGLRAHFRVGGARRTAALVVADLDGFKSVNDVHGHSAGDEILRASVAAWTHALHRRGVVGRWGGDEFVILLPAGVDAVALAEELQSVSPHPWTAGVARVEADDTLETAIHRADADLYSHKGSAAERRERALMRWEERAKSATWWQRILRHQTPFTVVMALAALGLGLTVAIDQASGMVPVGPDLIVYAIIATCAAGIVVPLALGHRHPKWAGIVAILIAGCAMFYYAAWAADPRLIVNILLEIPLFATLLAWFYRPPVVRGVLTTVLALVTLGWLVNPFPGVTFAVGLQPIIATTCVSFLISEVVAFVRERERRVADTDALTGALNRLGFVDVIDDVAARTHRRGAPLTLVVVDFDEFKKLNDLHGHSAGDAALRETVAEWRAGLRDSDLIARVGGDEFVLALPAARVEDAEGVVSRLQHASDQRWSWGAAEMRRGDTLDEALHRADVAMYRAKATRRDRGAA